MANKKSNQKKPKQNKKMSGHKGGSADYSDIGSPKPVKKQKKK